MPEYLTCGEVGARDLIQRYGARTLLEREAEALERHVLDCGTCWAELQAALDVRAALVTAPETESIPERAAWITRPRRRLWSFAAVAASVAIAVGTAWQVGRRPTGDTPVFRGANEELAIVTSWRSDGSLGVTWTPVPGGASYRVRILGSAGRSAVRQVLAPPVTLAASEVAEFGTVSLQIEGENAAGEVIARSALTPALRR